MNRPVLRGNAILLSLRECARYLHELKEIIHTGHVKHSALNGHNPESTTVYTVSEVASFLRCSKAHVHNLIAGRVRGVNPLPSIHLGRRSLVRKETLIEWLEQNESPIAMIRSSPNIDAADA